MGSGSGATLTQREKDDVAYVASLTESGSAHSLDFSDEAQWRFFQRILTNSGISPERNPQLLKTVEQSRELHRTSGVAHTNGAVQADTNNAPIVAQNLFTSLGFTQANNSPFSSAFSSIPGGTNYTLVYLELFDVNNTSLGYQSGSQYGQGEYVPVLTNGTPPPTAAVKAMFTYSYQAKGAGTQPVYQTLSIQVGGEAVGAPVLTQPVRKSTNLQNAFIKVGVGRTGDNSADCDYWYSEPQQNQNNPSLKLPFLVTQQFASAVTRIVGASLSVTGPLSGGGITLPSTTAILNQISFSGNTLSLNFPFNATPAQDQSAAFPPAQWPPDQLSTMTFVVQVYTQNSPTVPIQMSIFSSLAPPWTGDPGAPALDGVYVLRPVDFTWHCVASGTLVLMSDGTSKTIDLLVGGEEIRTGDGGVAIVNDTYVHRKKGKVITLVDQNRRALHITEWHSVMTKRGPIVAKFIRVGDVVQTESGFTEIISKDVNPHYDGLVYSISVGRGIEPNALRPEKRTFFANGILVADHAYSRDLVPITRKSLENILDELPAEWHEDAKATFAEPVAT